MLVRFSVRIGSPHLQVSTIMEEKELKPLKGKKKKMYDALVSNLNVVTSAARNVGIDRTTHYLWMNNDDNYRHWVSQIDEITVDFAETSLLKQIREGNTTATIFFLKTKAKHRGYIERSEVHSTIQGLTPDTFIEAWAKAREDDEGE